MKLTTRTILAVPFLALASACSGLDADFQLTTVSQTIQVQVGAEQRSATIELFAVTVDSIVLQNGDQELGIVIKEEEAGIIDDNDPIAIFSRGQIRPGEFDTISIKFTNASADTAQASDVDELTRFGFILRGTIDIDPNIPGEESTLFAAIPAPATEFSLGLGEVIDTADRGDQVFLTLSFDLEAFLGGVDFGVITNTFGDVVIDDLNNPDTAQEIQDNLVAALRNVTVLVNDLNR